MSNTSMDEYATRAGHADVGDGQAGDSTADMAKDQASQVSQSARASGKQVASTVADEASNVAAETRRQTKQLGQEVSHQAQQQAALQKDKAASGLYSLGEELRSMARQGGQSGPATDLAHQAADKVTDLAGWLEQRDPGSLLEEVRTYARRKPGTFLIGAAAAGIVAGRLTRGTVGASHQGANAIGDSQLTNGSDGLHAESGLAVQNGGGAMPGVEEPTPIADITAVETATNGYESAGRTL